MAIKHFICCVMVSIFLKIVKSVLSITIHIIDHFDKISDRLDVNFENLLDLTRFQVVVAVSFRFKRSPRRLNWILERIVIIIKPPFVPLACISAWIQKTSTITWEHVFLKLLVSLINGLFTKKVGWWIPEETT